VVLSLGAYPLPIKLLVPDVDNTFDSNLNPIKDDYIILLIFCAPGFHQNSKTRMETTQDFDIQQIETVLKDYVRYWNTNDMDSWGTLFMDDVDYINRNGGWWTNNEDNIAGHKIIHKMLIDLEQPKTFSLEIQKIDFLKPDVAVVQALSEWPGFKPLTPENQTKKLNGIMTCVFVKTDGKWLIKTLHNTLRG